MIPLLKGQSYWTCESKGGMFHVVSGEQRNAAQRSPPLRIKIQNVSEYNK